MGESDDLLCVLCGEEEENKPHLFRVCVVSLSIWKKVFEWIGPVKDLSMEEFVDLFFFYCGNVKCLKKRSTLLVIWLAMIWSLWLKRNAIIFKN